MNLNSFWRLIRDGQIRYTSNGFYVRSADPLGISFAPLSDDLLDEITFGEDDKEEAAEMILKN